MIPLKRFLRGSILFLLFCTCFLYTAAAASIRITLDDSPVSFDQAPFIENDRVLVPVRGILESLGYTVHWQEHTQTVLALSEDVTISLPINSKTATVNGKSVSIDAPAKIKNGRTFVPLRFLAEYSGAEVTWNGSTSTVSIYSADASAETAMKRSVVYIQTNKMQGSGVILSSDGLIATNYHVIENASTAQFVFSDGSIYQGTTTVVGLKPESDIAILHINKSGLKAAATSKSYSIGEAVTAIGAPGGRRNTVTTGSIRAFDRDYISSTAVISQGSSGGGLFNGKGQLIGMTSAYGDGKYFSIPIAQVLQVSQNLSIPISQMKNYAYVPPAPQNLRVRTESDGYAYVSWSPVYGADYYYVYTSASPDGSFTRMKNPNNGGEKWYWGFPYCFGISAYQGRYLQISAVVDGQETPCSEAVKISR
ncbi:MAG: stalk domain-containing protein [Anaerotignum sp.]